MKTINNTETKIELFSMAEIEVSPVELDNTDSSETYFSIESGHMIHNYDYTAPKKIDDWSLLNIRILVHNAVHNIIKKLKSEYELDCKCYSDGFDGASCTLGEFNDCIQRHHIIMQFTWFGCKCYLQTDTDLLYGGFLGTDKKLDALTPVTCYEKKIFKQLIKEEFLDILYESLNQYYQGHDRHGQLDISEDLNLPPFENIQLLSSEYDDICCGKQDTSITGVLDTYELTINNAKGLIHFFIDTDTISGLQDIGFPISNNDYTKTVSKIITLENPKQNLEMIFGRCNLDDDIKLKPGMILQLNQESEHDLPIEYNHNQIAKGDVVLCEKWNINYFGANITEIIKTPSERSLTEKDIYNTRVVLCGTNNFSDKESKELKERSIIVMDQLKDEPARIIKNDKIIALGKPIMLDCLHEERNAIKITKVF